MCNLYSQVKGQAAIVALTKAMHDRTGNLPPQPSIFPDQLAPIVRKTADGRELLNARWGLPTPEPKPGEKKKSGYQTNIRQPRWKQWLPWMEPEYRCLVPVSSFSEYDHATTPPTVTWFAQNAERDLFCFAGVWMPWTGKRGTKANPAEGDHHLFSFLTTSPNAVVGPVHPKAMPVCLLTEEDRETWLNAPLSEALALQRPAPDSAIRIVATGSKQDPA